MNQNPFTQDQWLVELIKLDPQVKYQTEQTLVNFKRDYLNQHTFIMTLRSNYIKFTHLIATNAIIATILAFIALSGVGAAAAQAYAPEQYRPSSILGITQPQASSTPSNTNTNQTDQTTTQTSATPSPVINTPTIRPLTSDTTHDVIVLKDCGLAIRYNNTIYKNPNYTIRNLYQTLSFSFDKLSIECSDFDANDPLFGNDTSILKSYSIITPETASKIQKVYETKNSLSLVLPNNKIALISFTDFTSDLFTNTDNLLFQFDSLAPSTASVDLSKISGTVNEVSTPSPQPYMVSLVDNQSGIALFGVGTCTYSTQSKCSKLFYMSRDKLTQFPDYIAKEGTFTANYSPTFTVTSDTDMIAANPNVDGYMPPDSNLFLTLKAN